MAKWGNAERAAAALAAVAVMLAIQGGRASSTQPGPAGVHCTVSSGQPGESTATPGQIVGAVRVACTGAAINSLSVQAKLQKRTGGKWVDVTAVATKKYTAVKAGAKSAGQASLPCPQGVATGTYRTAGRGTGTSGGKPVGSTSWTYGSGKSVTCK